MKFFKILPILLLAFFLTACDRGSRNPTASCEQESTLSVEGFNGETKSRDRMYQSLYATFKDSVVNMISKDDQAKQCLAHEVNKNEAKQNYMTVSAPVILVMLIYAFEIASYIILIYVSWSFLYTIWILAVRPKIDTEPDKERYPTEILLFNLLKYGLLALLLLPTGHDGLSVSQRYLVLTPVKFGIENALFTGSIKIAGSQQGNIEKTTLSQSAQNYSSLAFKAWVMTNFQIKAGLRDNRTAKSEYHEAVLLNGKYSLPVEHPSSMQYFYKTSDKIELKRFTLIQDDKNKVKVRHLLSYSGRVTFSSTSFSEVGNKIISQNPSILATTANEISAKAELMKSSVIKLAGEDAMKSPDFINKALIQGVKKSLPTLIGNQLVKEDDSARNVVRLVEEMLCTLTPNSPEIAEENKQFIKRVNAGDFWGANPLINRCIGQKNGQYLSYGQRDYKAVKAEAEAQYKALYDRNYAFLVSISAATKGIMVNQDSNKSCLNAREEGLVGFILYYDQCEENNIEQRELTDYVVQDFTFESVGFDHYIDTESRKNDDSWKGTRNMNDDFDPIIESLFKTIPIKAVYGDVPHEEYLKGIADSYNTKSATQDTLKGLYYSPIEYLKQYIGKVDDQSDPRQIRAGVKGMFLKGIKVSSYLIGVGFGASVIDNALELNKDKTSKTDLGYGGKGNGKLQKMLSGFIGFLTASLPFGIAVGSMSLVGVLYFAIPKIVAIIMVISYIVRIYESIINNPFHMARYARVDDRNNFTYHGMKFFNDIMYFVFTPTLIIFLYISSEWMIGQSMIVTAKYILSYPITSFMESIALILISIVLIWSMMATVMVLFLHGWSYIQTECFGVEDDGLVQFFYDACMFIVTWSLPFLGPLFARMFFPKRK